MQTVADLVADARDREGAFAEGPDRTAPYSYRDVATNAWKAGNLLRNYGVRHGQRVAVVVGPKAPGEDDEQGRLGSSPTPLVAVLGAALNGALVDLDPPGVVDATVLVAPADWLARYERGPGTSTLAYGGPPEDPTVAHFERESWSENPHEPPADLAPSDGLLAADRVYAHGDLLAASRRVVADHDLTAEDAVALRAPVTSPGALAAGVLAPMRVGATLAVGAGADADVSVVENGDDAGIEDDGTREIAVEDVF
ncbi:MAG: hypothetical protein ABEJ89_05585 [Haloarculaceae archaeon]